MNELDKEIDVNALLKATLTQEIKICQVGEMRPVYSQGPNGMVYSCAMSSVNSEQGFINGIPYRSTSYNYPGCTNGVTGKTSDLRGLSGICIQGCHVDLSNVIIVPPDFRKG
jgi:hypothetical protein